jgi:hypothetical protein
MRIRTRPARRGTARVAAVLSAAITQVATGASAQGKAMMGAVKANCRSDYMAHCVSIRPGAKEALQCLRTGPTRHRLTSPRRDLRHRHIARIPRPRATPTRSFGLAGPSSTITAAACVQATTASSRASRNTRARRRGAAGPPIGPCRTTDARRRRPCRPEATIRSIRAIGRPAVVARR